MIKNNLRFLLITVIFITSSLKAQFVHPGIYNKKSDLDRMKYMVEKGIEPYKTSFENFSRVKFSSSNYSIRKDPNNNTLCREGCGTPNTGQRNQYEDDVQAARHNAIMWYITGDERHAKKAVEILNAWSSIKSFYGGGTEPLSAGLYATPLVDAAEIMKHTYDGWADEDIKKFGDMLVYPGYSNTIEPTAAIAASGADKDDGVTFYWSVYQGDPGRAGNQGLLAWRSVMAIGIFLDNEIIYERALRQVQGMGHRSDDFAYASGPAILNGGADRDFTDYVKDFDEDDTIYTVLNSGGFVNEATVHFVDWKHGGRRTSIEDWGYDDQIQHYIWDNGQCEESSRDQGHSSLGLGAVADIAEIAWNQGDDIYSYMDNRLLMGLEYTAKYNLSKIQSYPDQLESWEPTVENGEYIRGSNRTGRREALAPNPWIAANQERNSRGEGPVTRPVYEMQTAHYNVRMGMENEALWLNRSKEKALEITGTFEDGEGTDAPGWGGLVFHRPEGCAGDPVINITNNTPEFGMHVLPETAGESIVIEAENYDYFSGNAEGRSYSDTTEKNVSGEYRVDNDTTEKTAEDYVNEGVDIKVCSEGGYNVNEIASGEWISYTVHVPSDGKYNISVRYASANEGGQIQFNAGGKNITSKVSIPFGGTGSTGLTDWKDFTVIEGAILDAGVQSLKVLFDGEDNAFELNSFKIELASIDNPSVNLALDGTATQSSTNLGANAKRAIDGDTEGTFRSGSASQTKLGDTDSWWEVELDEESTVKEIVVYNVTDELLKVKLVNFKVSVLNEFGDVTFEEEYPSAGSPSLIIDTNRAAGKIVRIELLSGNGNLTLAEVEVYGLVGVDQGISPINSGEEDVTIYPSIVSDSFTILDNTGSIIEIYNSTGKLVLTQEIKKPKDEVILSDLSGGVYFIGIKTTNGSVINKKVIKN